MIATKTFVNKYFDTPNDIKLSVVVTFFNHQELVNPVLKGILNSVELNYELIIINDGSEDLTGTNISDWLRQVTFPDNLSAIHSVRIRISRFETKCDNLGAKMAQGDYIFFLQGDMVLDDTGIDSRLVAILDSDKRIGAISGHSLEALGNGQYKANNWLKSKGTSFSLRQLRESPMKDFERKSKKARVCFVEEYDSLEELVATFKEFRHIYYNNAERGLNRNLFKKDVVFIGKYINRGPIIIENRYFQELGMYKDQIYFQGFDDIDLSLEICKNGRVVGFCPMNYVSKSSWGVGRKSKSWLTILNIILQILIRRKNSRLSLLFDKELVNKENALYGDVFVFGSEG